jgi:hypothetical protein
VVSPQRERVVLIGSRLDRVVRHDAHEQGEEQGSHGDEDLAKLVDVRILSERKMQYTNSQMKRGFYQFILAHTVPPIENHHLGPLLET